MREEQRFQPSYAFRTTGGVGNPTLLHNGEGKQQQQQQFRDQLATVAGWFQRWNQCERTVALYSLLKQVPACQARFLAAVLEQSLASAGEVHRRAEEEANSPAFLSMLGSQPMEQVVETLLGRLPLLRPGNEAARRQYLGLLPRILAHSVARGSHVEEARQLLSYSLIHPALGAEDRRGLAGWLGCLEDRISFHQPEPPQSTGWPPDPCPVSPQGSLGDVSPPEPAAPTFQPNGPAMKGTTSLSFVHECQTSGCADVPGWLKSLRLHKYANLFSNMTYEDMMALTEEQLETKGVTKGARHKIVLSIQKLKSRQTLLQNLEKEVQESPTSVRQVLSELKSLLQGPIQADSSPDGLTNLFTRVMGKICSTLLVTPHPEEDNLNLFLLLIEKCLSHERVDRMDEKNETQDAEEYTAEGENNPAVSTPKIEPPPPSAELPAVLARLAACLSALQTTSDRVTHRTEIEVQSFDGTYPAAQFFRTYDQKTDWDGLTNTEKVLRLPRYLNNKPLEHFRRLRMETQHYIQVRQTFLDLYPETNEATYAQYFSMKLAGQPNLEEYYRNKTALGLQLGLPQEVILETLTEGLPPSDQRLVRIVPPENLGAWFRLVQRIRGSGAPSPRHPDEHAPPLLGPYAPVRPSPRTVPTRSTPPTDCRFCGGLHWHSECRLRQAPQLPRASGDARAARSAQLAEQRPRAQPHHQASRAQATGITKGAPDQQPAGRPTDQAFRQPDN
ncbi:SAMD4A [Cordylochernes scorpioides]|uniref:SAMD4A n=1 Tax=Cordylochernes scorpioides TaxID=51811 RepID=A0ABY6KUL3_9ARAC|nr:SAMD4A [Cordylochernes scorpioides]